MKLAFFGISSTCEQFLRGTMDRDVRRTAEMTGRAVNFSDAHPDTDAGHAVSVGEKGSASEAGGDVRPAA